VTQAAALDAGTARSIERAVLDSFEGWLDPSVAETPGGSKIVNTLWRPA
jgi:hypothetical protein